MSLLILTRKTAERRECKRLEPFCTSYPWVDPGCAWCLALEKLNVQLPKVGNLNGFLVLCGTGAIEWPEDRPPEKVHSALIITLNLYLSRRQGEDLIPLKKAFL